MNPFKYLIMIPFGWILLQLYRLVGNYGVALILFSLFIKLVLLPLSMKSKKSMMKMSRLAPKQKALEEKYGDDKQKYQTELMKLYKEENVSMTGGCLWSLIPMLILIPLYYVVRQPLTYILGLSDDAIQQIIAILSSHGITIDETAYYYQMTVAGHISEFYTEIKAAVPDVINMNFNFLGISLSATPTFKFWEQGYSWSSIGLFLIPIISGVFNFLSSWLMQKMNATVATDDSGQKDEQAAKMAAQSTKSMMIFMPLMSIYIGFVVPAGLSIYWIAQSLFGMIQDFFLTRYYRKVYDAEDALKAQKAAEAAAIEAEKERRREERRAQLGNNPDPNTSKKKVTAMQAAQEKAKKDAYQAARAARRGNTESEPEQPADTLSGDPDRPMARGRSYQPDRYPLPQQTTYQPVPLDAPAAAPEDEQSDAPVDAPEDKPAAADDTAVD